MKNISKPAKKIKVVTNLSTVKNKNRIAIIIGNFMAIEVIKSRIFGTKLASGKLKS